MNVEETRERLFQYLDSVLKVSEKKFKTDNRDNGERMKWGRLIVQAVVAYGKLLEPVDLESRIEALEQKAKDGVIIPNAQGT